VNSIFTISLDFELHWGGFEKWPLGQYRNYFLQTRQVIPRMLDVFEKYDVHVTWASVGLLFFDDYQKLVAGFPDEKPTYQKEDLSAYHFIEHAGVGPSEESDPFHYGLSLIRRIVAMPHQELGSHTFSHFYCNEPGQTLSQFRSDLLAAQRAAAALGHRLRSLVFPRNQFNEDYLKVCYECGIIAVRDNPNDWFWNIQSTQHEPAAKRLVRGLDAYLPIGKKNTYSLATIALRENLPVCLPASRLLRPYRSSELFLNAMKIARIKKEMTNAARRGEVYHLWWHPHNFGNFSEQNLSGLEKILRHYSYCRERYGMSSLTMGETADLILTRHGKAKAA
jgi:peptidoglycan/xylan/chitin deacetylase (PgdA/CDA1 family)